MAKNEINTLKVVDAVTDEEFEIEPTQEDYFKILAGDYELANTYLQRAVERKNRILAMRLALNQNKNDIAECSKSEQSTHESVSPQSPITEDSESETGGRRWSDKDVKHLIELYRESESKFNNPKFRSKSIWIEIATKIGNFTWEQCQNKFKNLKKTYKRIVDNNKSSGHGKLDWPYFQLLDEIFKSQPENEPISLASSSSGFTSSFQTKDTKDCEESSVNKRKRTSQEPAWFKRFREDQERRHQERMQCQKEFLNILKEHFNK